MPTFALPMREYALVFGVAVLVTFLATGLVRLFAVKVRAFTPIRERDVHSVATPRMGGVAVYLGIAVALVLGAQLPELNQAFTSSSQLVGVLVAGGVICAVGVIDDRFDLDAVAKLAAQVLAAAILVFFGVQWIVMWLPTGGAHGTTVILDQYQSTMVTVLITLVLTNAMNFIDGLDGLLAGVAAISGIGLFVFSAHVLEASADDSAASQVPLVAAALVGACVGFLPHNFYPARIFMGDAGSMFIGLTMAAGIVGAGGTISSSSYSGASTTVAALAPLIVALAVVFIPFLDFLMAVVRRTREGRHPFSADKRHLHHRMLALGHSHREAVLVFYLWAAVVSGGAVSLAFVPWQRAVGPFAGGLVVSVLATVWPRIRARWLRATRRRGAGPAGVGAATVGAATVGAAEIGVTNADGTGIGVTTINAAEIGVTGIAEASDVSTEKRSP